MRRIESPKDMPFLRRSLSDHYWDAYTGADPEAESTLRHELTSRGSGTSDLPLARQMWAAYSATLAHASMYWVNKDMTHLALDASHDLPTWTPGAACPTEWGLLVWQGTLPPLGGIMTGQFALHGVAWLAMPDKILVFLLGDELTGHALQPMVVFSTFQLRAHEPPAMIHDGRAELPETGPIVALLGATWLLMSEPTVAQQQALRPPRRDIEKEAREGRTPPVVTTVTLRPLRHTGEPTRATSDRKLTVRHLVRGHWRKQFHPSDGSHRPAFIAPYIKGLITNEGVAGV